MIIQTSLSPFRFTYTVAQVAYQAYALGKPVELTSEQVQEIYELYGIKNWALSKTKFKIY